MASKSVAKRPNGRWRARYRDDAGREHARHFDRKLDAQRWLDEVTTSFITGRYVDPKAGRMTFLEWFDFWSDQQGWQLSTLDSVESVRKSISFGSKPIAKVTTTDVQAWVKSMSLPSKSRQTGLAASTTKVRFNYVRMAFIAAMKAKVIAVDPSDAVKLPTAVRASRAVVRRSEIPTADQVAAALSVSDSTFRTFAQTCAFAGLRLGEAAGLRVSDIDEVESAISVERQVQGQSLATTRVTAPKYDSVRTVYVSEQLIALLLEHAARTGASGEDPLFVNDGDLFNRLSAGNRWRRARRKANLPERFTIHSLRHFFASGLIAAGCDVATVQQALGHKSPSITLGVYTHLWPGNEDRARQAATVLTATVLGPPADPLRTVVNPDAW